MKGLFNEKHSKLKQFNKRIVCSGNILEIYEYEKPVAKGFVAKKPGRGNSLYTSDEDKADNRAKIAQRAKTTVRRYANANPQLTKFLTLTFAENITDLEYARYEFDKFVKRAKTRFPHFQYIEVVEFQKRGAIHFHVLCNLPYVNVNEFASVWKNGFVKINRIDNVDNVGAYITKYMTKDNVDARLIGKKCYTMSKGLNEPREYTNEADIEQVLEELENVKRIHIFEFQTEHFGVVQYTQIICDTQISPPSKFRRFLERFKSRLFLLPDDTPTPF